MHKTILVAVLALTLTSARAQYQKVWYTTSASDGSIFSLASVSMDGRDVTACLRWSPVFNFGTNLHWNYAPNAGFFTGWNIRNIGLITEDSLGKEDFFKRRIYMIGIPVAFKFGDMAKDRFFYVGGEVGYALHYKQKYFPDGERSRKVKTEEWFSDQATPITLAAFAGVHFRKHMSLKIQYFFNNFFNQSYTTTDALGQTVRPYANYSANIFFLTFGFDFKVKKVFETKQGERKDKGML
ncbi:MAG: hypothetical protein ABMA02_05400 [Saprospiraceae bacterium]